MEAVHLDKRMVETIAVNHGDKFFREYFCFPIALMHVLSGKINRDTYICKTGIFSCFQEMADLIQHDPVDLADKICLFCFRDEKKVLNSFAIGVIIQ